MSFFGRIAMFLRGLFEHPTLPEEKQTVYTSDIVADKDGYREVEESLTNFPLTLAARDEERLGLMQNICLEFLQCHVEGEAALAKAKAQGMTMLVQTIGAMQEKVQEIAVQRLQIIERESWQVIKEIECFYHELEHTIKEYNDNYTFQKLPQLLSLLEQYEKHSPAYMLYKQKIEEDMACQTFHYMNQLHEITQRQKQVLDNFLQHQKLMVKQNEQVTKQLIETMVQQYARKEEVASFGWQYKFLDMK